MKMKKFEWLCNLMLYVLFRWTILAGSVIEYTLSFKWIKFLFPLKRKFYDDRFHIDSNNSRLSMIYARNGFGMISLIVLVLLSNVIQVITEFLFGFSVYDNVIYSVISIGLLSIISYWVNSVILYKNKKYLNYFDEFDKMTSAKKQKYDWIVFFVVILIFCSTIGSLLLLYQIKGGNVSDVALLN